MNKQLHVGNPLTLISIFVGVIEIIATVSLVSSLEHDDNVKYILSGFIVVFPVLIAGAFFTLLWFKSHVLFGPGDFKDEKYFVEITNKLAKLEARQTLSELDPENADEKVLEESVKTLAERDDVYTAIHIGRNAQTKGQFKLAARIFEFLNSTKVKNPVLETRVWANLAYAYNSLGKYKEAIELLEKLKENRTDKGFQIWHGAALAYALYKLGQTDKFEKWVDWICKHKQYSQRRNEIVQDYPDMKQYFSENE